MSDRRKGPTWGWLLWGQFFIGERRKAERRTLADRIVFDGCTQQCSQGRNCTCALKPERK